ncbi:hypothetical protein ACLESD_03140 [Pyxidicoccus sp. 3LFB2]
MTTSNLKKLAALSLVLSSPAALADWRDDGFLKQEDDSSYNEGYEGADDSDESGPGAGFSLGLRAGYGIPFGESMGSQDEDEETKLSDAVSGVIPLQVDLGYFLNSNLYLGASFQYGIGQLPEDCDDSDLEDTSCGVTQLRFGVNVAYHFAPAAKINPWLGVGVGYESLSLNASGELGGAPIEGSSTIAGFEFANAQGGVDFRVSDKVYVGPFATFTVAQYSKASIKVDVEGDSPLDMEASDDIEDKTLHAWLYGGVRMQVRF